jgi:hypothetical protein
MVVTSETHKLQYWDDYLEAMKSLDMLPMDYDLWYFWQVHYHGENAFKERNKPNE